jgi:hypothetical protein
MVDGYEQLYRKAVRGGWNRKGESQQRHAR